MEEILLKITNLKEELKDYSLEDLKELDKKLSWIRSITYKMTKLSNILKNATDKIGKEFDADKLEEGVPEDDD